MESNSSMEQQFLKKLTEIIDANVHNEHFGVTELAAELGMSRTTVHRKLKSIFNKSVSEFIRETRLKRAFELLHQRTGNVSEIAFTVGFGSTAYFNRCFHKQYGFPPGEVLKGMHQPVEPKSKKNSFRTKVQSSKILYVLSSIILLATVAVVFFQNKQRKTIEKTIAVLPPKDISPEGSPCIMLEGFREDLQSKLYSINKLLVSSGTTTDTYRNSDKSVQLIAKELNVDYIVEIRGQYIDNINTIWVQLIETKTDKHIWAETFSRGLEDEIVHEIQQEIALSVAANLNITLSPKELKTIEKRPSEIPAAYSYYRLGKNLLENYILTLDCDYLYHAKDYFEKAIQTDTAFADAYCQLSEIYISHLYKLPDVPYNACLDSGMMMTKLALKYNTSLKHKTIRLQAEYYRGKGEFDKALSMFEKLWGNRKKDFSYYSEKTSFYVKSNDFYNCIENALYYLKLKPESVDLDFRKLNSFRLSLFQIGFPDVSEKYNKLVLEYDNDSVAYKFRKAAIYLNSCEFDKVIESRKELYLTNNLDELTYLSWMWFLYYYKSDLKNAFNFAQEFERAVKSQENIDVKNALIGSLYRYFGNEVKAQWHIDGALESCQQIIEEKEVLGVDYSVYSLLVGIYSLKGEKTKALEYLQYLCSTRKPSFLSIFAIEHMLMYYNIREEPEYKAIMDEMKMKYMAEHNRVKKLLKKEGILDDSYEEKHVF